MIYYFLDTNIFITEANNINNKVNSLKILFEFAKVGIVKIIIPEVVILEFENQSQKIEKDIKDHIGKTKCALNQTLKWSELSDVKDNVYEYIDNQKQELILNWKIKYNAIKEFFDSNNIDIIELSPKIICETEKRIISGNYLKSSENDDKDIHNKNDLYIIDSLKLYFRDKQVADSELIFCSNNFKHFSNTKKKKDVIKLNDIYSKDFNIALSYYTNLESAVSYINKNYENKSLVDYLYDEENSKYTEEFNDADNQAKMILKDNFIKKILPNLPRDIKIAREEKYNQINEHIKELEKHDLWDERTIRYFSENVEGYDINMLSYISLYGLIKAEKYLKTINLSLIEENNSENDLFPQI